MSSRSAGEKLEKLERGNNSVKSKRDRVVYVLILDISSTNGIPQLNKETRMHIISSAGRSDAPQI